MKKIELVDLQADSLFAQLSVSNSKLMNSVRHILADEANRARPFQRQRKVLVT